MTLLRGNVLRTNLLLRNFAVRTGFRWSLAVIMIGLIGISTLQLNAEEWPQWRGPQGSGITSERGLPTTWSKPSEKDSQDAQNGDRQSGSPIA